ncbi:MAG: hypothetical protein QM774_01155 [Gordonia sp. (in: high G+C Gram-positive bacteria)]|uniref:hypothetical protein n=1 Tax=Gordonia sp. (in: high G+C Gram-positive bacteria) TaxID=84139 RepID=UPI0039E6DCF3
MSVLGEFLAAVDRWHDHLGPDIDLDELEAPHRAVADLDLEAFGRHADHLRATADALDDAAQALAPGDHTGWDGAGGDGLADATRAIGDDVTELRDILAEHARTTATAHDTLDRILRDYRAAIADATAPVPATGTDAVRAEVATRVELATAAGTAAAQGVDDTMTALADEYRSAGELVLAGER